MSTLSTPYIDQIITNFEAADSLTTFCLYYLDLFLKGLSTSTPAVVGLIAASSAAIAAYFTISTNRFNARVKNSIDFETNYKHNENMADNSERLRKFINKHGFTSPELEFEMHELGRTEMTMHYKAKMISKQLNEWERCANGCSKGVYNEKFLYGTYGNTVVPIFNATMPYILSRQNAAPNGTNHSLYCKFVWLATRWQMRKSIEAVKLPHWRLIITWMMLKAYHSQSLPIKIIAALLSFLCLFINVLIKFINTNLRYLFGESTTS